MIGGARLKDSGDVSSSAAKTQTFVQGFTICLRVNLRVLGTESKGGDYLLHIGDMYSVKKAKTILRYHLEMFLNKSNYYTIGGC
jgi:hydrogenase maturation factor